MSRTAEIRRQNIVEILILRKYEKVDNLANELEVSTDTILRDISALRDVGEPIYTVSGRYGGGIYWDVTAPSKRNRLRNVQIKTLKSLVAPGAVLTEQSQEILRSILMDLS